jgi:hypothetical protein
LSEMFGSSRWSPMGSNSNAGCDESFKHRLSGTGGKHGAPWSETRSVVGQTRRFDLLSVTSDVHSTSDVSGPGRHFAVGPKPDVSRSVDRDHQRTAELSEPLGEMALAVQVLHQIDLPSADSSCLAIAGCDLMGGIEIDDILPSGCPMPAEVPISRGSAKYDACRWELFRYGPIGTCFSQFNFDVAKVCIAILVCVKIVDAHSLVPCSNAESG